MENFFLETEGRSLEEDFKIKKNMLKNKFNNKLLVSENENIIIEDKKWIIKKL